VNAATFFSRWRVRLGYPLAIIVLFFARPTPGSIVFGTIFGFLGLAVRAYAAGYLHKQKILTVTGPYTYTRNPLYLGSAFLVLGVGIAAHSWVSALILWSYFGLFYFTVMRREEQELRAQHGQAFEAYASAVPLFLPRISTVARLATESTSFSFPQYKKNREYRAAIGFLLVLVVLFVIWRLRLG
jgi:protein-S-isoprenylcysteine O-methyltransferase Ste14